MHSIMRAKNRRALSRRQLLANSWLSSFGLNLYGLLRAQQVYGAGQVGPRHQARMKSCILIFYYGGPSHLDTFDMKPEAPAEIRGEFNSISTPVPGLRVCEHLPHTATLMHKVAVIRSMHHSNRLHDSASTEVLTGRPSPNGDREEFSEVPQFFPCYGATLSYQWREKKLILPHAALPWTFHNVVDVPCQSGGFLGPAYNPFQISGDPDNGSYRAEFFSKPRDLTAVRISQRRALLETLDRGRILEGSSTQVAAMESFYRRAYDLLGSEKVRRALNLEEEDRKVRDRYGLGQENSQGAGNGAEKAYGRNLRGQNLLLARRLVEAGVPFVNVYDFKQQGQNWDSHSDNFKQHKDYLLPAADRAFAALVNDLDERGLLETTLVVAMGEFGRTPRINSNAGRDHWPDCYSVVLAGGGVRGGAVYGTSDKIGAYPDRNPVTPGDLAATLFWRFGLDSDAEIHDPSGRPFRIAEGKPIQELFEDA